MPESTLVKPSANSTIQGLECPLCRQRAHQFIMTYPAKTPLFRNRTVASCVRCDLAYMYPMASTSALNAYYNSGAYWGHMADKTQFDVPAFHHQAHSRVEFIKSRLMVGKKIDILDIGAGYGVLEKYLRGAFGDKAQCSAVELDKRAQESLTKNGVDCHAALEDFEKKKFDLIVLSHVLEHMNDPVGYLKKLPAYSNKDAYIFVEVPNEDFKFKFELEPHVLFFSPKTLTKVLKAAGYHVVATDTCGFRRPEQRKLNERAQAHNEFISKIPFRSQLKRLKHRLFAKNVSAPSDPLAAPDPFFSSVYGDDRIWIRCLAKLAE